SLCADDVAELYLSTDSNPANKKLLARDPGADPDTPILMSAARDYTPGETYLGFGPHGGPHPKLSSLYGEWSRWPVYPTKYDNFLGAARSRYDQFQGGG